MTDGIINSQLKHDTYHLTPDGQAMVERSLRLLQLDGVDLIYASPFTRTQETAKIAAKVLHRDINTDERLVELNCGTGCEGKPHALCPGLNGPRTMDTKEPDGESWTDVRLRLMDFMTEMESKYRNKKILIVSHGDPLWLLNAVGNGSTAAQILEKDNPYQWYPTLGELKKITWRKIPRNETGELDLHRPYIDSVVIKCPKCKSKMRKIPDLIDVWFDSGAMPFAQWHYPFENKPMFKNQFPADFIVEAIDQTRGWFWTLLAIATSLGYSAPYKNVMVLGHTLDEKGQKMSKSKKNFVPVMELMDTYGADVLRWYLFSSVAAGEGKAIIAKEIEAKLKGFVFTLQNCIRFYELYAVSTAKTAPAKLTVLDKWILSRLHRLIADVSTRLEQYDVVTAVRAIENFVTEDLSNWWVRRSRKRKEALPLLRLILLETSKLLAPFVPFMAEDMYRRLGGEGESVHLTDWPKPAKKYLNENLESEMAQVKDVIAMGLAQRKEKQLKVRQPLRLISLKRDKLSKDLESLIKDELNIKQIKYDKSQEHELVLDVEMTPALIQEGYARELMRQIQDMRKEAKYRMDDLVFAHWHSDSPDIVQALATWSEEIKRDTLLKTLEQQPKDSKAYDIEKETELAPGKIIWLGIKK